MLPIADKIKQAFDEPQARVLIELAEYIAHVST